MKTFRFLVWVAIFFFSIEDFNFVRERRESLTINGLGQVVELLQHEAHEA